MAGKCEKHPACGIAPTPNAKEALLEGKGAWLERRRRSAEARYFGLHERSVNQAQDEVDFDFVTVPGHSLYSEAEPSINQAVQSSSNSKHF